jgi:hypothetical protein
MYKFFPIKFKTNAYICMSVYMYVCLYIYIYTRTYSPWFLGCYSDSEGLGSTMACF